MQVFLRGLEKTKVFEFDNNSVTVKQFMDEIKETLKIPNDKYSLYFGGKILHHERSFADYNIHDSDSIEFRYVNTNIVCETCENCSSHQ